ncbi:hypothetical protein EYC80_000586 [Monilinia laxa]|uniref:Uncharacterized protein n=1 Tax=Monilinia laxa TaxID=61186 RepID=A0A5N6KB74_MONLA|nr:hypothetical protein EYC80_000586 [Monilinia laxa]
MNFIRGIIEPNAKLKEHSNKHTNTSNKHIHFQTYYTSSLSLNQKLYFFQDTGGVKKDGLLEQKAGGSIPDDQEKVIVEGMHSWSSGKYTASVNRLTKIVVVKCHEKVATKDAATKAINEQEQLVNSHIKKTKRDNDDDLVVDDDVDDDVNDDINDDIDNASDDDRVGWNDEEIISGGMEFSTGVLARPTVM